MWFLAFFIAHQDLSSPQPFVFREDFREVEAHIPVNNDDLTCDFLTLERLGPGAPKLKLSFHPEVKNDPHYIWNGQCEGPVFVTFLFDHALDLTSEATKVHLRTKNVGETTLHLALQTDSTNWFVQEVSVETDQDWTAHSLRLHDQNWLMLDAETLESEPSVQMPSFEKVTALGFFAPKTPNGSKDCFRLDWFELRSRSALIQEE